MKTSRIVTISLFIVFMFLGACKLDFGYQIWLNADQSGKARIESLISFPNMGESMDMSESLSGENGFGGLEKTIAQIDGAKLIVSDHTITTTEDEMNVTYFIEFSFDNLAALNAVFFSEIDSLQDTAPVVKDDGIRITKKGKDSILTIDTKKFSLQSADGLQEYLSLFDINLLIKLNLPSNAKAVTPQYTDFKKQKELNWSFKLDDDWYQKDDYLLTITY